MYCIDSSMLMMWRRYRRYKYQDVHGRCSCMALGEVGLLLSSERIQTRCGCAGSELQPLFLKQQAGQLENCLEEALVVMDPAQDTHPCVEGGPSRIGHQVKQKAATSGMLGGM